MAPPDDYLMLFMVEHVSPPTGDRSYARNHTTWVVIHGDALDAAQAVRERSPGDHIVKVTGHNRGKSLLVVDGEPDG